MPTPPLSDELAREALQALSEHGNKTAAADALGINRHTYRSRLMIAEARGLHVDPAIQAGMDAVGAKMVPNLAWIKTGPNGELSYSLQMKMPTGDDVDFGDMVRGSIEDALGDKAPTYAPRPPPTGQHMLVVDLADVHFLKLSVQSETGTTYSRDIARHRVIEGTRALLAMASGFGVGHILFVLGNDILHVDGPTPKTTSGTPQDTDGSIFQGFSDAFAAIRDAIELCAEVAPVQLIHCMSNHDWTHGWALSQKLGAWFARHPNVSATDYNLSETHRKYIRFGSNLFGLSHGDGAKEEKLYALMVTEARQHISECKNMYWLLHHVHHKDRKRRGVDVFQTEKDHNGMTAISTGSHAPEGSHINIEYVRSPSAPDGWHHRNGYMNRQGVECFVYHPHDGQKARFTEWF